MSAKEPRRELAATQIDIVRTVLMQLFPHGADGIGTHPEELAEAEIAAQVASNLFRRAAEVHQGLLVSWKQMCDTAFLSAAAGQLNESQGVLKPLLRQLGVELVRQDNWRKGAALPGFRVARSGRNEGAREEQPDRASEPEDLTAIDGELVGAEMPEICSSCEKLYPTCGHQPGTDDCEGFGK